MTLAKKEPLELLVSKSVTQTLTRSIYSTLTTFVMVFILFLIGVSSIRDFAAPLMVGIAIGGYTSVCLTGSTWFLFKHIGKNKYVPAQAAAAEGMTAEVSAMDGSGAVVQKKKKKKKRKQ